MSLCALVLLAKRLNSESRGWRLKETKVLPPGLVWVESGWEMGAGRSSLWKVNFQPVEDVGWSYEIST